LHVQQNEQSDEPDHQQGEIVCRQTPRRPASVQFIDCRLPEPMLPFDHGRFLKLLCAERGIVGSMNIVLVAYRFETELAAVS
jgi:hypothetical protein